MKWRGTDWRICFYAKNGSQKPRRAANYTVQIKIFTSNSPSSMRNGFTDQRLGAHGGIVLWFHFLQPYGPSGPTSFVLSDTGLGLLGGTISGSDKLSGVAWPAADPVVDEAKTCRVRSRWPTTNSLGGSCGSVGGRGLGCNGGVQRSAPRVWSFSRVRDFERCNSAKNSGAHVLV